MTKPYFKTEKINFLDKVEAKSKKDESKNIKTFSSKLIKGEYK